ncbi:DUF4435 domain-containing protein [Xanthomonas campestris]|uniref:DUF4435 domain-containing protein n=1 Tax=Xanthomonas campestris TaxID=339 RepID=UPI0009B5DC61|nr:DUF4435 domain-containing protein [Xanthomonas campestris]MEA9776425.1 DUF4435 domain-containing protein [Xanthomonas campestris pv. raphani]MEA9918931.1 DUF4435 domain-containing protein [Xanthomonas campestris pv. raphani]
MDYAAVLRGEAESGHAQYHEYVLSLGSVSADLVFLFFEGDDDPAFYNNYIVGRVGCREYREFVCNGRVEVLKAHELVARDGRGGGRALFFVDKDLTEIIDPGFLVPASVFQTSVYSFENYLVCHEVFRRYWVERLRLPYFDRRFAAWSEILASAHANFMRHCKVLMALILIGRGVDGGVPIKLNLNNASLKNLFDVRIDDGKCRVKWRPGGLSKFVAAVNLSEAAISAADVRKISRRYLYGPAKRYVRGKYELWFFVRFLQEMTRQLSDRTACAIAKDLRARPVESINEANFVALGASLTPCPGELAHFLDEALR